MAYVAPTSRTTGTLITAAIWNQDVVDNVIALRGGGIAVTGQSNGRFMVASSASQLSAANQSYVKLFSEVFG